MLDFAKSDGLVPVIVQDFQTLEVLMLGYMNEEAWEKTQAEKRVTFFSRSKNRLWTKAVDQKCVQALQDRAAVSVWRIDELGGDWVNHKVRLGWQLEEEAGEELSPESPIERRMQPRSNPRMREGPKAALVHHQQSGWRWC